MMLNLMIERQEGVTWQDWTALADAVESSGLEGLYRSDHYLSGDGFPGRAALDAWATLAGIAGLTHRIRLGTMVSPVTFRHPSVLASMVTTVDHISGGRVELGLGTGWYGLEHQVFGFEFPPTGTRMGMLEEQLELLHALWTTDEVSFSGQHYALTRCSLLPKPIQQPPPIIVGGSGKARTVTAAARFAAEYNCGLRSPAQCRELRSRLDQECLNQGRDPSSLRLSMMVYNTVIGTDRADLAAKLERIRREFGPGTPDGLVSDDPAFRFAGTVDEIVERLSEFAAAGVDRVMLQHLLYRDLDSIALLGETVVPRTNEMSER
jgi:F420-dependent oxidoreductase-like protein